MDDIFSNIPLRSFKKGQILLYEGDPIEYIYYLVNGYVKVFNISPSGNQRTIIIFAPGDTFPLVSFLSGRGVTQYFYECMTDAKTRAMPQAKLQQLIKGNLEMGEQLIYYTSNMSQQFIERIETLSAQDARHKVLSLLDYLVRKSGEKMNNKIRLRVPLTSQDIADMCSLTRETTSVQLIRLKKEGIIAGRRYLIIDREKLKKLAKA